MTPIATPEPILQEEGAETALLDLAREVAEAEENLRAALGDAKGRIWSIRELQDEAANGHSSSVVSIAFLRLLKAGELRVDPSHSAVEAI